MLKTSTLLRFCIALLLSLGMAQPLLATALSPSDVPAGSVKVFAEPGFPTADSAPLSSADLHALLPGASFVDMSALPRALADADTRLLVLPYGSAFPEAAWGDLLAYLDRGGNLLVLGGMPFTRAAYLAESKWVLRDYSVRFAHVLLMDQWQQTPGSSGLAWEQNRDIAEPLPSADAKSPPFSWNRAFSPVIHLSSSAVSTRIGSAGRLDARLDAMGWGARAGIRMAAPVLRIDHVRGRFAGGRWVFVSADLPAGAAGGMQKVVAALVASAIAGAEEFRVVPDLPLYLPGEAVTFSVDWTAAHADAAHLAVKLTVTPESDSSRATTQSADFAPGMTMTLPSPQAGGFYRAEARLMEGDRVAAVYRSGFWIRDEKYLQTGPKLAVDADYFQLDGKPIAVVGTTYMASDVQRLFFEHPNAYVWDRDMEQIQGAGLNMIRTGWWSGLDKLCDENGRPYERTLRTMEAYLMTARKHGLPVQFNVFAFLPDVLGGVNAYLDPAAIRRQQTLLSTLAVRFRDVPFLAWDLINEPSFGQHMWEGRPNGDAVELAEWNKWLAAKYPSRAELQHDWNLPAAGGSGELPVPGSAELAPRAMYDGANSLKVYDFYIFSQETFAAWVAHMRDAIRGAGSQQLVTVGQDEGGITGRLSPAYFGAALDFTTNHSWWENDSLLWDSLIAKQPGKPMLIQETGLQRELTLDEVARRTPENEGALFERKVAMGFVEGAGAIQWLWNTNDLMLEGNEAPIGAVRADGTEKPEAAVLRGFGKFAQAAGPSLAHPEPPPVVIVTSEAAQYSPEYSLQLEAQRKAVRALCYADRTTASLLAESRIAELGQPKLVILPSPQALSESTWQTLLTYVKHGGSLLVTGAVNRNEHWRFVDRMKEIGLAGVTEPLTYRTAAVRIGDTAIPLSFEQAQQTWLEAVKVDPAHASGFEQVALEKGQVYWAAYPVELADGTEAAARLYAEVLRRVGIAPLFEADAGLSPGVLISPTILRDAVLYVVASDDVVDTAIRIRDKMTGAQLAFTLPSQHAALIMIRRRDGAVIAKYGF